MMYPFLSEIASLLSDVPGDVMNLQGLNQPSTPLSPTRPTNELVVYSGHDTVIAPVLAALGIYKSKILSEYEKCKWPPYASRIVFEVWSHIVNNVKGIRVLYNGKPVTQAIPSCTRENKSRKLRGANHNDFKNDEICPIELFLEQIDQILENKQSYQSLCQSDIIEKNKKK